MAWFFADGCSLGILSPRCRENNEVSSKTGALIILRGLLNLAVDADSVPAQTNKTVFDTIVKPDYVRPIDGVQVEPA